MKKLDMDFNFSYDTFNDFLDYVKDRYHLLETELKDAKEELKNWNKDEEIQSAYNEVERIRKNALIILDPKEREAIEKFRREHYKKCAEPLCSRAAGNTYIYTITGTGIGEIIKIKCPICGEEVDVTNVESW